MINKLKYLLPALIVVVGMVMMFAAPTTTLAQCAEGDDGTTCVQKAIGGASGGTQTIDLQASFGFSSLPQAINTIIALIFLVAGLVAFFFILLGAFNYLTAGDSSEKTGKARSMITNAVIGLILVALVYVIWLVAINLVPGLSDFFSTSQG